MVVDAAAARHIVRPLPKQEETRFEACLRPSLRSLIDPLLTSFGCAALGRELALSKPLCPH